MEAYAGGAGSSNATAEKEGSSYVGAGSMTKAEKERALLMLKNLKLEEEKAHAAGSKTEKKEKEEEMLPQNPVADEFPFSFELVPGKKDGGVSMLKAWGSQKRRRKVTHRLGKEYIEYMAENPLPPLYIPDSRDMFMSEIQQEFVAKQMADYEERDMIIKQIEEFGYADVEVEVADGEDYLARDVCTDGYWHSVKAG